MVTPPLRFDTLAELLPDVDADRVWAKWTVTSAFGPETMQSERRVSFGVADDIIDPACPVHALLQQALFTWLELSQASERERIDGEGSIGRDAGWLTLDATWTRGVPYDWGTYFDRQGPFLKLPE